MSKTILVTGASSGFGQHIASRLVQSGHQVFGTSRNPKADQDAIRMLPLDLTEADSIQSCIERMLEEAGRIDVLINNAGCGLTGPIEHSSIEEIRWQMDTNFFGAIQLTQLALAAMRPHNSGRLITIGSLAGHAGMPFQGFYSASKYALEAVNEALRLELHGSGIDSTIVCPGDFQTGFTDARVFSQHAQHPDHQQRLNTTVSIYERDERQGAKPEQLAELVAKLVEIDALKVRYFVGRADQTLGIRLKGLLPANWFEAVMRLIYKIR